MTTNINIQKTYDEAIAATEAGDNMRAIVGLTKVLDNIRPKYGQRSAQTHEDLKFSLDEVYAFRAKAWFEQKEYEIALLDINEAVRESPQHPEYYAMRADIRRQLLQYGQAIVDWTIAIDCAPNDSDHYYFRRSIAHFDNSDFQSALQDIDEAIERHSSADEYSMQCLTMRARILLKLAKFEVALKDCEKVIMSETTSPGHVPDNVFAEAFLVAGEIHVAKKEYSDALEQLHEAIKRDPTLNIGLSQARCFFESKEYDKAMLYCNAHLEANPNSWEALVLRGRLHYHNRDNKNAEKDCKSAYQFHPNIDSCNILIDIYRDEYYTSQVDEWGKRKSRLEKKLGIQQ